MAALNQRTVAGRLQSVKLIAYMNTGGISWSITINTIVLVRIGQPGTFTKVLAMLNYNFFVAIVMH